MNDPLALRTKEEAWAGPLTRTAVIGSPSGSVSLPRTPGVATFKVPPSATVYASLFATGGRLHVGRAGSPAGSDGAAGEQLLTSVGNVPAAGPFVGNDEPEVVTLLQ